MPVAVCFHLSSSQLLLCQHLRIQPAHVNRSCIPTYHLSEQHRQSILLKVLNHLNFASAASRPATHLLNQLCARVYQQQVPTAVDHQNRLEFQHESDE